jgi:predicted phage terminase large subunit-like protein
MSKTNSIDLNKLNMTEQQMVDLALQTNLNKYENLNLLMEILKSCKEKDYPKAAKHGYGIATTAATSLLTGKAITNNEVKLAQDYYELARRFCTYGGRADFDLYMIACEWNREPNARFWLPRRRVLEGKHHIATKIQNFIDDPKKLMFTLSTPPGAGKSTLIKFLLSYIAGQYPRSASMYVTYSDGMVKMMYDSIGSILTDTDEYKHNDIFPYNGNLIMSAEYNTLSYRRKGDFATVNCVSLGGSVTGRTRANKFMITDDLVRNAEMARSPERLQKLWDDYRDTITTRQIGDNVKHIMLGTIWSLYDPISRIKAEHEDDDRYEFVAIPVEDEFGHSNFLYDCADRYTDDKIKDIKETLDTVTYSCLYLQKPMEREGLLFEKETLNYYNGVLPPVEPDRVVFACDVAFGGGDSLSMPIAYIFDGNVYIHDVVFNRGDKSETEPIVIGKIEQHKPHAGRFEANNGGDAYAMDVSDKLSVKTNITWKKAPTTKSKVSRIIQYAPDIKKFFFLDKAHRSPEYQKFFDEFVSFVQTGKSLHDDAPDSLAQLAAFISDTYSTKIVYFERPF